MNCSDWHAPFSLSKGNLLKFTSLRNIDSWICAAQHLHARTSVTSYTSVNIYNLNSRLAHFNTLWMEYIRLLRTGIMAEYPVVSTSQGTYAWIEQTSEAIRVTYDVRWLELRTTDVDRYSKMKSLPLKSMALSAQCRLCGAVRGAEHPSAEALNHWLRSSPPASARPLRRSCRAYIALKLLIYLF